MISGWLHPLLAGVAVGASVAPVPALSVAIQLVDQIIKSCENVQVNREAIKALQCHCQNLIDIMVRIDEEREDEKMQAAIRSLVNTLYGVRCQTQVWASYGTVKSYFLQSRIVSEIGLCSGDVAKQIQYFELEGQNFLRAAVSRIEQRMDENNNQEVGRLRADMKMLQERLRELDSSSAKHKMVAQDLYNIQISSKMLLPHVELNAGEVRKIGTVPIGGTAEFDFWEGLYLEGEKCLLKIIRVGIFADKQKSRLKREVEIWRKVWDVDKGEYCVPFYGVCYFGGPWPCLVSPFYNNGDALSYIRKNPDVDRIAMLHYVAKGLRLLHSLSPPIAHGELKAAKIMISDTTAPLITDFGLSKMIEGADGAPFTRTCIVSEQFRWLAPEVCSDAFIVTTAADVYSFAMTMLEDSIFTGAMPFAGTKRAVEVIRKVVDGERPTRPLGAALNERGLDDKIWKLMQRCWAQEPKDRPTMDELLEKLPTSLSGHGST